MVLQLLLQQLLVTIDLRSHAERHYAMPAQAFPNRPVPVSMGSAEMKVDLAGLRPPYVQHSESCCERTKHYWLQSGHGPWRDEDR